MCFSVRRLIPYERPSYHMPAQLLMHKRTAATRAEELYLPAEQPPAGGSPFIVAHMYFTVLKQFLCGRLFFNLHILRGPKLVATGGSHFRLVSPRKGLRLRSQLRSPCSPVL